MDGQYAPAITPLGAYHSIGYPAMMLTDPLQPRLHQLQTLSMESLGTYSDYDDQSQAMLPPQIPSRSRRRQHQNPDHVKHRRTRSGCYTCRQRRVKCDETQPICDRCRKGKRECAYPGTSSSPTIKKPMRNDSKVKDSPSNSSQSDSEPDDDDGTLLSAIPDEDEQSATGEEPHLTTSSSHESSERKRSVPEARTPSIDGTTRSAKRGSARPRAARRSSKQSMKSEVSPNDRWSSLPKDVRYYLTYHRENMSHHHYAFKYDGGNFLTTKFIEIALDVSNAALLYAIVAFAAYHHTVSRNDDKISTFLSYYNKSIAYLQQSLKNKRHSVVTLLTILQLATIEEFLGDWVNLLGHHKAAYQILTDLFTPHTIMQDETCRHIINWYFRFDLFAGMIAGERTTLGREWFAAATDHYKGQTKERPDDLGARFEDYFATGRLLATDVTLLFAAKSKEDISDDQFTAGVQQLTSEFTHYRQQVETAFRNPASFVTTFPRGPPVSEDDIVDYRDPNFLYAGELSTMNFVLLDHWALDLMFRHQLARAGGQDPPPELTQLALKTCKMLEAIQYGDEGGSTAMLGAQASLGFAAIFLPKDDQHGTWCRRKFADVERLGYIYPTSFRTHMSEIWSTEITSWWLPDETSHPSSLKMIKEFVEYRTPRAIDALSTGVRDMSGIFRSLNIEEPNTTFDEMRRASAESSTSPWVHESSPEQPWH